MKASLIQNAIHRIDGWLSSEPVFCSASGAVAGVTAGNEVVYWYGEIAGYYLCYLASLMAETARVQNFARHAAKLIGQWLQEQWNSGTAPTRLYMRATEDWRNDFVFAFDLAMILRGVTAVRRSGTKAWHGRQSAEFIKLKLIDGRGKLRAVHANTADGPPITWSTCIDGHQLKTAAGLMAWGMQFHDFTLRSLGKSTMQHLATGGVCDWPHLPLHPRLYALEGSLLCDLTTPGSMAAPVKSMLASIDVTTERIDAIAQLLRLALFSRIEGKRTDALALRLLESIDADGSVAMRLGQANNERNTWCAIFARQALSFYGEVRRGRRLKPGLCI